MCIIHVWQLIISTGPMFELTHHPSFFYEFQGKVNADDVKSKLAKVGNLDDLKARLVQMKEVREKIKTIPSVKKADKVKEQEKRCVSIPDSMMQVSK